MLEGQHLQLERHCEPILRAARPEPEEALAGLEHGARSHGLEAVEVGQAIGIGLVRPGEPESLDLVLEGTVLDQRGGLDPAADRVCGEARRGIGGIRVGAHELSGPCPLQLAALEDQAVDGLATGAPGDQATLHLCAIESCALGELTRRQEPSRSGDALDQVHCSEALRGVDPNLADGRLALQRLQLALELGDRPGDLGRAPILHRPPVIGHAGDGAVALRLQRFEACFELIHRSHISMRRSLRSGATWGQRSCKAMHARYPLLFPP